MPFDQFATTDETIVQRMIDLLLRSRPGELVTKAEIHDIVGHRQWALQKARARANREAGASFKAERGKGLRRLPDGEAYSVGDSAMRRVKNTTRRAAAQITNTVVRSNSMSNEEVIKAYSRVSVLNLINAQANICHAHQKEAEIRVSHSSCAEAARDSMERLRSQLGKRRR